VNLVAGKGKPDSTAILDFGFCAYSLIATQNAAILVNARSTGLTAKACTYAYKALQYAPNVTTSASTCPNPSPSQVTATFKKSGADQLTAVSVSVTYTVALIAVPGISPSTSRSANCRTSGQESMTSVPAYSRRGSVMIEFTLTAIPLMDKQYG
jgi:hypothetical protein